MTLRGRVIAAAAQIAAASVPLLARAALAQSVIPSDQLQKFLCANYNAITGMASLVLLVVAAITLIHGLVVKRSALVFDLVIDAVIVLVILNLQPILTFFQITANCPKQ
jgi:TRAP-type C4-dicarboxylate transport system permease large subunit